MTPESQTLPNRKRQDPSPADFDAWERKLADGDEPSQAARELGFTASGFRRIDPDRHAAALQVGRLARADFVDRTMEKLAVKDDPAPAIVLAWAKRWNPAYVEKGQLEVTGADGGPVVYEGGTSLADVLAELATVGAIASLEAARGEVPAIGPVLAELGERQ